MISCEELTKNPGQKCLGFLLGGCVKKEVCLRGIVAELRGRVKLCVQLSDVPVGYGHSPDNDVGVQVASLSREYFSSHT